MCVCVHIFTARFWSINLINRIGAASSLRSRFRARWSDQRAHADVHPALASCRLIISRSLSEIYVIRSDKHAPKFPDCACVLTRVDDKRACLTRGENSGLPIAPLANLLNCNGVSLLREKSTRRFQDDVAQATNREADAAPTRLFNLYPLSVSVNIPPRRAESNNKRLAKRQTRQDPTEKKEEEERQKQREGKRSKTRPIPIFRSRGASRTQSYLLRDKRETEMCARRAYKFHRAHARTHARNTHTHKSPA